MLDRPRRTFLCWMAGTGASLGIGASLFQRSDVNQGDTSSRARDLDTGLPRLATVNRTSFALGSHVSITAVHADEAVAKRGLDAAFAELEIVEATMSLYRPTSQLCRLNRDGVLLEPHPYLVTILRAAHEMSVKSSGAFDVSVQPLWSIYESAQRDDGLPSADAIAQAVRLVDSNKIHISDDHIRLGLPGMQLTLNGIAQGFAADRAAEALQRHGVEHALIDTGEFHAVGSKSLNKEPWTIGIQHPRAEDQFISLAKLNGRCLATSGDYATKFSADFCHHHLINPRSGTSPVECSSVSIIAPTATLADAISTAAFVMGIEEGMELVRRIPDTDALFVSKDGRIAMTDAFVTSDSRPVEQG